MSVAYIYLMNFSWSIYFCPEIPSGLSRGNCSRFPLNLTRWTSEGLANLNTHFAKIIYRTLFFFFFFFESRAFCVPRTEQYLPGKVLHVAGSSQVPRKLGKETASSSERFLPLSCSCSSWREICRWCFPAQQETVQRALRLQWTGGELVHSYSETGQQLRVNGRSIICLGNLTAPFSQWMFPLLDN